MNSVRTPSKRVTKKARVSKNVNRVARVPRTGFMSRLATGFPEKLSIVHRYVTQVGSGWNSGTNIVYLNFSCNSLQAAFVANQPLYYDQLTALYGMYTVNKSRIKVTFPTIAAAAIAGVLVTDAGLAGTETIGFCSQQPSSRNALLTPTDRTVVYNSWSRLSAFGAPIGSSTSGLATNTYAPVETEFFSAFINTTLITPQTMIELEYETVWSDLKNIATS